MPSAPPPTGPAYDAPPPPEVSRVGVWQQLDPKMLIVTPIRTLISMALPLLVAIFGVGRGNPTTALIIGCVGAFVALVFGILPWFTTRYRFTETQVQVRRGLISRAVVTAPLDRVRSVDLESTVLHRVLGLAKVQIGTGVDDSRIELDALARPASEELRTYLLKRSDVTADPDAPEWEGVDGDNTDEGSQSQDGAESIPRPGAARRREDVELAAIDWSWLRFAPFSLSALAIVAAVFGIGWQFVDGIDLEASQLSASWQWVQGQSLVALVGIVSLLVLIGWVILSTASYVLNWWNLRLVRQPGGTLKLTRGLMTTRSTTVEEARVRGVRLTEPVLMRAVNGAELSTLATGVGTGGTTKVLPPCPRSVAESVGATILQEEGPLTEPLRRHGPAARRRQFIQAQWTTLILTTPVVVLTIWLNWEVWIPIAVGGGLALLGVLIGWQTYRNLGHYLTTEHLVAGSGSLQRTRTALERRGVIGWVVHQSYFQRRRGLATLVATTAAGPEQVDIRDVPLPQAIAIAHATTPEVLRDFLAAADGSIQVESSTTRTGWGDLDL